MKIFISYNSSVEQVNKFAKDLKTKLQDDGIEQAFIFQDVEDNPTGRVWSENLGRAIYGCDIFIAIITQKYLNSDICHREISYARDTCRKPVLPIIFKDRKPNYEEGQYAHSIHMIVQQVNYITFETTSVDSPQYGDLLRSLKSYNPSSSNNRRAKLIIIALIIAIIAVVAALRQNQENLSYTHFIVFTLFIICGIIAVIFIFYCSRQKPSPSPTLPPAPAESTGLSTTTPSSSTSKDVLKEAPEPDELLRLLADVDAQWYEIGLVLKIPKNELEKIPQQLQLGGGGGTKLSQVIDEWIRRDDGKSPVTWETVISAFEGPVLRNRKKANEIRQHLGLPKGTSRQ